MRIPREDGHADCEPRIKGQMGAYQILLGNEEEMPNLQESVPNPLPTKGV